MIDPTKLRILVVDDNEFARTTACALLQKLGMINVTHTESGANAIALLLSDDFDVLILDWYMPDVSGAGLLQILRDPRTQSANKNIPVIVMTAYATRENLACAKSFNIDDILIKPVELKSLRTALLNNQASPSPSAIKAPKIDGAAPDDAYLL